MTFFDSRFTLKCAQRDTDGQKLNTSNLCDFNMVQVMDKKNIVVSDESMSTADNHVIDRNQ